MQIETDKVKDIDQMRLIQDIGTYASEFFQRNGMLPKLGEPVLQPAGTIERHVGWTKFRKNRIET